MIERSATNGSSVVLLGAITDADCNLQSFAWVSADGRKWQRSEPFGDPRNFSEAEPVDVWAVPGGWEAAIADYDPGDPDRDVTAIWQSADGLEWTRTATLPGFGSVDGEAAPDGTRVLSTIGYSVSALGVFGAQVSLRTSADGVTWSDIDVPASASVEFPVVTDVVAPAAAFDRWLLQVDEYQDAGDESYLRTRGWLSSDLEIWEPLSPPRPELSGASLTTTSLGLMARACDRQFERCPDYITRDGKQWSRVTPYPGADSRYFGHFAEGPGGVLKVSTSGDVYRLQP